MKTNANTIPHLSEAEVALLLKPSNVQRATAAKKTRLLSEDRVLDIFADMARQHKLYEVTKVAELCIRDLFNAQIAGDFFASLFPDPKRVKLGIMELLVNAIEHGNLEITTEEKKLLMKEHQWQNEINVRLQMPKYASRLVHISCYRHDICTEITIRDEGNGFNWTQHMDINNYALTEIAGRGIACAHKISFDEMRYIGNGNTVKARQYFV